MTRLLLDEGVPRPLAKRLKSLGADAVYFPNAWKPLNDKTLIVRARDAGFDVLVTNDRSMPYQQTLSVGSIAVLVLPTLRLEETLAFGPRILSAAQSPTEATFTFLTSDVRTIAFDASAPKP